MLDIFERLINEHGSSTILRERLELFSDKYSILEDKNTHLSERVIELESKLDEANREIRNLNQIIESTKKSDSEEKLNDVELQILTYFFDTNQQLLPSHVSQKFGIAIGNAEYHINKLLELGLLHDLLSTEEPARYQITMNGRSRLIENK